MRLSALKAIRKFCLECQGGSTEEVKNCTANPQDTGKADDIGYTGCPLYPYRLGKSLSRKGKGNPNGAKALIEWRKQHKDNQNATTNTT